jgi:hypothetical protein
VVAVPAARGLLQHGADQAIAASWADAAQAAPKAAVGARVVAHREADAADGGSERDGRSHPGQNRPGVAADDEGADSERDGGQRNQGRVRVRNVSML